MNDTYKKIGDRIKHHRTNKGLSQDQLAEGICSRQTISLLENGQHFPSADFMKQIAVKLSVPFHEIMVDEAKELEAKVQLDVIKVYVEIGDYSNAFPLIEELDSREELLEYQRRELVLSKAECLLRTGKADHAVDLLTDLQQRLEIEREADDQFMAALYDKLGTANFILNNLTNAHAQYARAYQLSLRFAELDLTAARIAYNLGMVCRHLNRQSNAIEYLSRAKSFFEKTSDVSRLAHTFFELGIAYSVHRDYEQADNYLQESLAIYRSINVMNMARLARQVHALTVLSQKDPDQAIRELQECADDYEKVGDVTRSIYTKAQLANVLISQKHFAEAESHLRNALSQFNDQEAENDPRLAFVYQVKARYLLSVEDFDKCLEYSFKSSTLFDKMGLVRDAADSLNFAAKAYRGSGMIEQAYDIAQQVNEMLCQLQDQYSKTLGVY